MLQNVLRGYKYIIFLVNPYHNNIKKRIIKSPKLYFYDTGIVSYITGIQTFKQYDSGPMAGAIFENYIISEIKKKLTHKDLNNQIYFLRTSNGEEIDLIFKLKDKLILAEIKKNSTPNIKMLSTIKKYLEEDNVGYLIYMGEDFSYSDNLKAKNFDKFLIDGIDNLERIY